MQADILSGRDLVNGIALMNTAMNLTAILGPALGGALLACCGPVSQSSAGAAAGVQWAYGVLLLLHLVQLGNYTALRLEQRPPAIAATSLWQNLVAGLRYSCSEAGLWTALALAGLVNFVAFPLQFGLLPIFAREVFGVGAAGLGLLGAALGAGALLGSFLLAWGSAVHHAGRLMLWGTTGWFVLLLVFAFIPDYTIALGVLVLIGIAQTCALTNMTVSSSVPPVAICAAGSWGCARLLWPPCFSAVPWPGPPRPASAHLSRRWAARSLAYSSPVGWPPGFRAA
jgi:hypothetical protein